MITKLNVIDSTLNSVGKNFDYRKKEISFDIFKTWFENTEFKYISSYMGWGEWESSCGNLFISTASFDSGCWLYKVRHKTKANNQFNNFVNAIAYWDMLNKSGRNFFLDFYKKDILKIKLEKQSKILNYQSQIETLTGDLNEIDLEINSLTNPPVE